MRAIILDALRKKYENLMPYQSLKINEPHNFRVYEKASSITRQIE